MMVIFLFVAIVLTVVQAILMMSLGAIVSDFNESDRGEAKWAMFLGLLAIIAQTSIMFVAGIRFAGGV